MRYIKIYLIPLILIFSSLSLSQTVTKSYKILGISVVGNKSADAAIIIANSGLKIGDEIQIPGDKTLNAIKQLWSLNIFSDIQIINDKQIADGILIFFPTFRLLMTNRLLMEFF